ncbi:MAG: YitT family protein [Clostridium sp.]
MLATVLGGLLIGAGIGLVIRAGSSTGGNDVPVLLLKKKLGIPLSVTMYGFDIVILLFPDPLFPAGRGPVQHHPHHPVFHDRR